MVWIRDFSHMSLTQLKCWGLEHWWCLLTDRCRSTHGGFPSMPILVHPSAGIKCRSLLGDTRPPWDCWRLPSLAWMSYLRLLALPNSKVYQFVHMGIPWIDVDWGSRLCPLARFMAMIRSWGQRSGGMMGGQCDIYWIVYVHMRIYIKINMCICLNL